jgi:serine protease Do
MTVAPSVRPTNPVGLKSPGGLARRNTLASWAVLLVVALLSLLPAHAGTNVFPAPPIAFKREEAPLAFRKSSPSSLEDLKTMELHVERLVARVSPAVVAVQVGRGAGSGVVVTADGLVLCAAHVCGEPGLTVRFTFPDGRTAQGKTLGANHEMDSGLMKITDPGPWPHIDLANPGSLRQGDWVLALGHPGGFDPERAVVARLGRVIRLGALLQTDCTLMSGDSGGPLFDMTGHVVAIHSRISEATSENFHVPVETYIDTWPRLMKGELWGDQVASARPTIGVRAVDAPGGCRLESVNNDGPAWKAGLKVGDLVRRIEDEEVTGADFLVRCIRRSSPGDVIKLVVARNGTDLPVQVKVEAWRWHGERGRSR